MDAAVFGAGVAGLMTAIALRSAGCHSRIYERSRQSHDAGMGFILVPECIQRLQSYEVELPGVTLDRYLFRDDRGRILNEQIMPEGTRGIRRPDLIAALLRCLGANGAVVFDSELVKLDLHESAVVQAEIGSGERRFNIKAELYVAADGIGSRGRHAMFPGWPLPPARVPEIVGLVRCRDTIRWAANNFNKFHALDGGIAVGVLPVDAEHVVWFMQFDEQRFSLPAEDPQSRLEFVRRLVGQWTDPIPHLLSKTDFNRVHLWLPVDSDLVPHFNQGNLALVGDAAHPLMPFTSQGVSCAVADAIALANALHAEPDVARALANYSAKRLPECASFVARGRQLMQHFLQPLGTLAELPIA